MSRLICRHVFHEKCLSVFFQSTRVEHVTCPECRGSVRDPKNFLYISKGQFHYATESSGDEGNSRPKNRNPEQPLSRAQSSGSHVAFPFWQMEDTHGNDTLCYHGNTILQDGRQGLLVDPGAWSNLAGEAWIQAMAEKALAAGHDVAQGKLPKPMRVAGVGRGTDHAEWEVHVPIALIDVENQGTLHEFRSPVIGGAGRELPALLGLQSMSRQNGVLEMAPGNEHLTLPGPGGYTINWSPGTVRYRLEKAVSGHLILPCDEFGKISSDRSGLVEPKMTFYGNFHARTTCEVGTQTEPEVEVLPRKNAHTGRNKWTPIDEP